MIEENKAIELKEEDLVKVTGGDIYMNNLAGNSYNKYVTTENAYCKYCNTERTLLFVGTDIGYEGFNAYQCNIWRCQVCNCNSYIRTGNGKLL